MGGAWGGIPSDRVVAVVAGLDTAQVQVGSGYLVTERLVLTARHCAVDKKTGRPPRRLWVARRSDGLEAEATLMAAGTVLDVAVLEVEDPPWEGWLTSESPRFGRVDRTHTGELRDCQAVGFPLWQYDPADHGRNAAELHGTIRVTEDAESGFLVMRDPDLGDVVVPATAEPADRGSGSPWGGLSGALVFCRGIALGVVVEHHPRQGRSAIRILPAERFAEPTTGADADARAVAAALDLAPGSDLPAIGAPEDADAGQLGDRPLMVRVYNFDMHTAHDDSRVGSRLPGILLNQLLRLDLDASQETSQANPIHIWGMRSGPDPGVVEGLRKLAPFVMVTGYVEDADTPGRFVASVRVSIVEKDVQARPLLVEEVEFEGTREGMTAGLGNLADRIWQEASRVGAKVNELISDLLGTDEATAAQARVALLALGPVREIGRQLERQADKRMIGRLVSLLTDIQDPEAGKYLAPLLELPEPDVEIARTLADWDNPAALPVLLRVLGTEQDPQQLADTVRLVCKLGDAEAVPVVARFADHPSADVRLAVVDGLRRYSLPAVTSVLADRLGDRSPRVRIKAAEGLRSKRDPANLKLMQGILGDSDQWVRRIGARALADLGDASGLDILLDELRDSTYIDFSPETKALLLKLRSPLLLAGIRELLRSGNPAARGKAAELAEELADPVLIGNLEPLVSDPEYFPRFCALRALAAIGHPDCRPMLVLGLHDEHNNCAEVALHGYVKLGAYSTDEVDVLRQLVLEHGESEVKFYASWLLAGCGEKRALSDLVGQVSYKYFMIYNWFTDDRQLLSEDQLMKLLTSLVPATEGSSSPQAWAQIIQEQLSELNWNRESGTFTPTI